LDQTTGAPAPRLGETIDGKYVVERTPKPNAASGGAFPVRSRAHSAIVTMKLVIGVADASTDEGRRRFKEGAHVSQSLESPFVAKVIDSGLWNGRPYLVMDQLEGEDLENRLAKRGTLAISESVDVTVELAHALAHLHEQGLVHCDIRPTNVFIAKKPGGGEIVKLLDCGMTKARYAPGPSERRSPLYMSPEQVRGTAPLDVTTDVWSLATILYEMIGGKPPFADTSIEKITAAVLNGKVSPLRFRRVECPPPVETAVAAALVKEVYDRMQHAEELGIAVAPWGSARSGAVLDELRAMRPANSDRTLAAGAGAEENDANTVNISPDGEDPATMIHAQPPLQQGRAPHAPPSSARALAPPMTGGSTKPRKPTMPTPATTPLGFSPMPVSQAAQAMMPPQSVPQQRAAPQSMPQQPVARPAYPQQPMSQQPMPPQPMSHHPMSQGRMMAQGQSQQPFPPPAPTSSPAVAAAPPLVRPTMPSRPEFTPSGQRDVMNPAAPPEALGSSPNAVGSNPNVLGSNPHMIAAPAAPQNYPAPTVMERDAPAPEQPVKRPPSITLPLTIAIVAGLVFLGEMIAFAVIMARS
jgi:serine/threonine-protein kinase